MGKQWQSYYGIFKLLELNEYKWTTAMYLAEWIPQAQDNIEHNSTYIKFKKR